MDNIYLVLIFNTILFALLLGLQVIYRVRAYSLMYALSSLDEQKVDTKYQLRIRRAKNNQAEFLLLLFSLFFVIGYSTVELENIALVALVLGRATYLIFTICGVAYLRSITWMVGFLAWGYLLISVLNTII